MKHIKNINMGLILAGLLMLFLVSTQTATAKSVPDIDKLEYISGKIDRIASDEIVVDDSLYKYSSKVLFLSRAGSTIKSNRFKKGYKVRIHINKNNRVLIVRKP